MEENINIGEENPRIRLTEENTGRRVGGRGVRSRRGSEELEEGGAVENTSDSED